MRNFGGLLLVVGVGGVLSERLSWLPWSWLLWVGLLLVLVGGLLYALEPFVPREAAPISRVVGRPCMVCDKLIAGDQDGAACPVCGKYFHFRCGKNRHCPTCGPPPKTAKKPA